MEEGAYVQKQQIALTIIMKLFCGLISVILIVLRTVNLQFHNQFAFP